MTKKLPKTTKTKELLFSVTAKDCTFIFQRGRGNGGQKKNKTDSACICTHKDSGAQGYAEDHRSQLQNKQLAFMRMTKTEKFKTWHTIEVARHTGKLLEINAEVEKQMRDKNLKLESWNTETKKWENYVESPDQ